MKALLFIVAIFVSILTVDADISIKFFNVSFRIILNEGNVKEIEQNNLDLPHEKYCIDTPKVLQANCNRSQDFLDTIEQVPNDAALRFAQDSTNMELCINSWQHGVLPSIKMAQAIIESASGTSDVCRKTNNHFGIRCQRCDSSNTYSKQRYSYFRSKESCFDFHNKNYNKLGRYRHLIGEKSIYVWATQLRACYYAGDDSYPQSLMHNIMLYDLYKLDEIAFEIFDNKKL